MNGGGVSYICGIRIKKKMYVYETVSIGNDKLIGEYSIIYLYLLTV